MATKVALVQGVRRASGLAPALAAVGLARSTWYYRQQVPVSYPARHAALRGPLERIARAHPDYGYRRTTTELREAEDLLVNQKVVRRLHRLWALPLLRRTRSPRPSGIRQAIARAGDRANLVAGRAEITVFQLLYPDFTQLRYAMGKAWLMTLLDHRSKVIPGWALGTQADTVVALAAWRRARRWLRRHGVAIPGLIVHHDRDPVYTGYGWTRQLVVRDHVRLSYALHGCRDNPEMEAFHSRFKAENRSLFLDALDVRRPRAPRGPADYVLQWSATALIPRESSSPDVLGKLLPRRMTTTNGGQRCPKNGAHPQLGLGGVGESGPGPVQGAVVVGTGGGVLLYAESLVRAQGGAVSLGGSHRAGWGEQSLRLCRERSDQR